MLVKLSEYALSFNKTDCLEAEVDNFSSLLDDIVPDLNPIEYAYLTGLKNRLSRLTNVTILNKGSSTDNANKWCCDLMDFINLRK